MTRSGLKDYSSLTNGQLYFYYSTIMNPLDLSSLAYISFVVIQKGNLKFEVFRQAWIDVMSVNDIFNVVFIGNPPRMFIDENLSHNVEFGDLSGFDAHNREVQKVAEIDRFRVPINLEIGPTVKIKYLKLTENEGLFLLRMHHSVCDGYGNRILFRQVFKRYADLLKNPESVIEKNRVQYKHYVELQAKLAADLENEEGETYWSEKLSGLQRLTFLENSTENFAIPQSAISNEANITNISIDLDLIKDIRVFCKKVGMTPFCFFLASFRILLSKCSGIDDCLLAAPFDARGETFKDMSGLCTYIMLLRSKVESQDCLMDVLFKQVEDIGNSMEKVVCQRTYVLKKITSKYMKVGFLFNYFTLGTTENLVLQDNEIQIITDEAAALDAAEMELFFLDGGKEGVPSIRVTHLKAIQAEVVQKLMSNYFSLIKLLIQNPDNPVSDLLFECDIPISTVNAL